MTDLRTIERDSIRAFIEQAGADGYLSGRVLDYGCGKQPYRNLVESFGGEYVPFDRAEYPANVGGETHPYPKRGDGTTAIICTQVIQYVPNEFVGESESDTSHYASGPAIFLGQLRDTLYWGAQKWRTGLEAHLVLTYPTNWPEVEPEDLHRFTKAGMERLLAEAGFEIVRHVGRFQFFAHGSVFIGGYGVIARA